MLAVDIDPDAISVASENVADFEVPVDLVKSDVLQLTARPQKSGCVSEGGTEAVTMSSDVSSKPLPNFIDSPFTSKVEYERWVALQRTSTQSSVESTVRRPEATPSCRKGGRGIFDCVLMNPPFGTQQHSNGIDVAFLLVNETSLDTKSLPAFLTLEARLPRSLALHQTAPKADLNLCLK